MSEKIVQLKDLEGNNLYPIAARSTKIMTGATSSADGAEGFVPAPAAGDQNSFLKGDGTWTSVVDFGSAYFANIGSNYNMLKGSTPVNVDDCIWEPYHLSEVSTVEYTGRLVDKRVFAYATMTDPISNTSIYGECETTIYYNYNKYHVIQEFTAFQDGTMTTIKRFRRKWYTETNSDTVAGASWIKLDWYPIEYPFTSLTISDSLISSTGNYGYAVSGGVMTIYFRLSRSTAATAVTISSLPALPVKYPGEWVETTACTISSTSALFQAYINMSTHKLNDFRGYFLTANTWYFGTLSIPLGY